MITHTTRNPLQGFGLGLRTEHYQDFLNDRPSCVDWLEIISENYMVDGGKPLFFLEALRQHYPMVMHGVSLSIGSTDAIDLNYLRSLKALAHRVEPAWISDHLCWTGVNHCNLHDLLPLPYTQAALTHLDSRIQYVQDYLQRPLVLENVSSYIRYTHDEMTEWEFITQLAHKTGCQILLDVNNVYVSSVNHHFDPKIFIDAIPSQHITHIHLAGHEVQGDVIIDTHDNPICQAVYDLYAYTLNVHGEKPTMIERDDHIPPLTALLSELDQVRNIAISAYTQHKAHHHEIASCQH